MATLSGHYHYQAIRIIIMKDERLGQVGPDFLISRVALDWLVLLEISVFFLIIFHQTMNCSIYSVMSTCLITEVNQEWAMSVL